MRGFGFGLVAALAAGCSSEQVTFEHQSQLETRTRGVALLDDSSTAQVGMSGNTCEVETSNALIGADYDVVSNEDDHVQDAHGQEAVVVGTMGVWVVEPNSWVGFDQIVTEENVHEARLYDGGVVTLAEDCLVSWTGTETSVALESCSESSLSVDRDDGTAFVGSEGGLSIVTPDGATAGEAAGDLVAWDAVAGVAYVAQSGGSGVAAVELDGSIRWEVAVEGTVQALDDMGELGAASVMIALADGTGLVVVLDGETGQQISELATPEAASEIVVGNRGRTMAFILNSESNNTDEVHFFAVDLASE